MGIGRVMGKFCKTLSGGVSCKLDTLLGRTLDLELNTTSVLYRPNMIASHPTILAGWKKLWKIRSETCNDIL